MDKKNRLKYEIQLAWNIVSLLSSAIISTFTSDLFFSPVFPCFLFPCSRSSVSTRQHVSPFIGFSDCRNQVFVFFFVPLLKVIPSPERKTLIICVSRNKLLKSEFSYSIYDLCSERQFRVISVINGTWLLKTKLGNHARKMIAAGNSRHRVKNQLRSWAKRHTAITRHKWIVMIVKTTSRY